MPLADAGRARPISALIDRFTMTLDFSRMGRKLTARSVILELMDDLGRAMTELPDMLMLGGGNPAAVPADIGGMVIAPGTYKAPVSLAITGNVTLDGQLNPNSTFIFQMASTLPTSATSAATKIIWNNFCENIE